MQYKDWVTGLVQGDLGDSLKYQVPAWNLLKPALEHSLKLALIAFLICVPLSIFVGVLAALRYGKATDKGLTTASMSFSAMPEFVSGILLILIFAVWLGWLPVSAQAEPGASLPTQFEYLLLPAFTLTLVLLGYIARITRASMIEALESDYARTARLKGLKTSVVVRRHLLRNALLPTIAVVAVQVGYLIGGLVIVEVLFNYQGIGKLTFDAAQGQGPDPADRRRPRDRHRLPRRDADRGPALRGAQPAHPLRERRVSTADLTPTREAAERSEARTARSERFRLLLRSPRVGLGLAIIGFWVLCAIFPGQIAPHDPIFDNHFTPSLSPSWSHPFGTDTNGRDIFSRVLAGSRSILVIAPAATLLGVTLGSILGLITGYMRGVVDDVFSRFIDAVLALPLIITALLITTAVGKSGPWVVVLVIGLIFAPVVSRTVRAAVLGEAELDYVQAARLRGEKAHYIMGSELLPNVMPVIIVEATVRLGYAIFTVASLTFIGFGVTASVSRLGRSDHAVLPATSTRTGG